MNQAQDLIYEVAKRNGFVITEEFIIDAKDAKYSAIPSSLNKEISDRLALLFPKGLYHHQAKAIELGLSGKSLCVATPTASGKTVIFTTIAVSLLMDNPGKTILAIYPAKALIHDQYLKWKDAASSSGIEVSIIHGGVPRPARLDLLKKSQVVLMTPDTVHAWLLSSLTEPIVRQFIATLDIVVLDEAHVYDGVFGTNMAFLLRRLRAVSGYSQVLASSATIGDPVAFIQQLTGLDCSLIGASDDGAAVAAKQIMLCPVGIHMVDRIVKDLLAELESHSQYGRFILFVDSRKKVEELTSVVLKQSQRQDEHEPDAVFEEDEIGAEEALDIKSNSKILPYRAGYEERDRENIQLALADGKLRGVISTSALELGLDIGEITLVINLGTPSTIKSFWQRSGRAGRRNEGFVLILETDKRITSKGLSNYLKSSPEPNWLYMDNEYLQYANALCGADERQQCPEALYSPDFLDDLPESFRALLENEINPTQSIPSELYHLQQQALTTGNPHYAFPLRTGTEKNYRVECPKIPAQGLGTLTYSQVLREAFPGAIYRYLGKPFRVWSLKHFQGKVIVSPNNKGWTTQAISQTMVFPQFLDETYFLLSSGESFIAECKVQVSTRVVGFIEQSGMNKVEIKYEPGCQYSQKPLNNYYDTTGICFYFPEEDLQREAIGRYLASSFCRVCAVQDKDVGSGMYISSNSPLGNGQFKGFSVFDTTAGSLRLTRRLISCLEETILEAIRMARDDEANRIASDLEEILIKLPALEEQSITFSKTPLFVSDDDWVTVVSANQEAICNDGNSHVNEEVFVLGYIFTPQGIRYRLQSPDSQTHWQVSAKLISPLPGKTVLERYNINTGETQPMN